MRLSRVVLLALIGTLLVSSGRSLAQQKVSAQSPDGKRIATGKGKQISVLDAATGREVMRISAHRKDVTALAFSPDGKVLASADGDGTLTLIDGANGRLLRTMRATTTERPSEYRVVLNWVEGLKGRVQAR